MKEKLSAQIQSYLLIFFGSVVYCLGWSTFILPHHLTTGGATGISAVIQYCTGFNMSYSFAIINGVLLIIALKTLGKAFGVKTVFAVACITVLLRIFPEIIPQDFIESISLHNDKLLCAIIGGGITGIGASLMIANGGSSGGTDIIALLASKYYNISPGRVILLCDIGIIASTLIIPSDGGWGARVATVVYCYVIVGVFSVTLDHVLQSNKQCVQLFIFSNNFAKIADRINSETRRGVSVIGAEGWFSKKDVKVLMVTVRKSQLNSVMSIVKEEDPAAFTTVGNVYGVYGEGFESLKIK